MDRAEGFLGLEHIGADAGPGVGPDAEFPDDPAGRIFADVLQNRLDAPPGRGDKLPALEMHHPAAELVVDQADDRLARKRLLDRAGVAFAGREISVAAALGNVADVDVPAALFDAEGDVGSGRIGDPDVSGVLEKPHDPLGFFGQLEIVDVDQPLHHVDRDPGHHAQPAVGLAGLNHVAPKRLFGDPGVEHVDHDLWTFGQHPKKLRRFGNRPEGFRHQIGRCLRSALLGPEGESLGDVHLGLVRDQEELFSGLDPEGLGDGFLGRGVELVFHGIHRGLLQQASTLADGLAGCQRRGNRRPPAAALGTVVVRGKGLCSAGPVGDRLSENPGKPALGFVENRPPGAR